VPDEILIEHEKKDSKIRPGKMKMRSVGVVDDDGNVIGRYISISNTSTGGFPRVPATQIWQHDPNVKPHKTIATVAAAEDSATAKRDPRFEKLANLSSDD
jgi:hypothetical protein